MYMYRCMYTHTCDICIHMNILLSLLWWWRWGRRRQRRGWWWWWWWWCYASLGTARLLVSWPLCPQTQNRDCWPFTTVGPAPIQVHAFKGDKSGNLPTSHPNCWSHQFFTTGLPFGTWPGLQGVAMQCRLWKPSQHSSSRRRNLSAFDQPAPQCSCWPPMLAAIRTIEMTWWR